VGDGFKAACLDYGDGRMSMYLFLPDEDSSLKGFYDRLDSDGWARWLSGFETGPTLIILPRFSLEYDALLNDALKTLGMRRAFGGADFGRMTSERVFISMVKHNARLEVNEEGTEATSAALVGFKKGPVMRLAFTRPFCLAVVDNTTGAILFIGTVVEP
jgi:serine protease inhibitor